MKKINATLSNDSAMITSDSRRYFMKSSLGLATLLPFLQIQEAMAKIHFGNNREEAIDIASQAHVDLANYPDMTMFGNEQILMLVYPGMTMLDLVGPQYFFNSMMGATVHLVTVNDTLEPVMGDTKFAIVPTITANEAHKTPDIFFVPGGASGTLAAMQNQRIVDYVSEVGSRAKLLTSVCTGSLLLAQAGLLKGKNATSHWAAREVLNDFGAIAVNQRVVEDGHIVTGAGVSAGIDFAISILMKLRGRPYAEAVQLQAEYAPQPPIKGGTPETTEPKLYDAMHRMFAPLVVGMKEQANK